MLFGFSRFGSSLKLAKLGIEFDTMVPAKAAKSTPPKVSNHIVSCLHQKQPIKQEIDENTAANDDTGSGSNISSACSIPQQRRAPSTQQ